MTELPFLGEGEKNYNLWLELRGRFASPGDVKISLRTDDHDGWILMDGRAVTTGPLRQILISRGSPFGTIGSDPKLPDCRGRAPVGTGTGAGLTARALGAAGGTEPSNMPDHYHYVSRSFAGQYAGGAGNYAPLLIYGDNDPAGSAVGSNTGPTTGGAGGGDNMMPFIGLGFFVYGGAR